MSRIEPLIAEDSAYLVYSFEPADDQSLEVKLERDPQLEILVKSVEMSLERPCRGASCIGDEHGGLDLHEALGVEVTSDRADYLRSLDERVLYVGIHNEVDVSLTVSEIRIRETVKFFGQKLKALRKESDLFRMDRSLAGLRFEYCSLYTDDIAHVHFLESRIGLLAKRIPCNVSLNGSFQILDMTERRLAHDSLGHHTPRNGDRLSFERLIILSDVRAMMCYVILCYYERIVPLRLQIIQLFAS